MTENTENRIREEENPLGTKPVGGLLRQFTLPGIIALVVNSLYNVVDQVFIGNFVGEPGNAATNTAFPLTTLSMSLGLLFGIGGASAYNLARGERRDEDAPCLTQLSNMVVQITLNNTLKLYGGRSIYGEAIPIAVVGVITNCRVYDRYCDIFAVSDLSASDHLTVRGRILGGLLSVCHFLFPDLPDAGVYQFPAAAILRLSSAICTVHRQERDKTSQTPGTE